MTNLIPRLLIAKFEFNSSDSSEIGQNLFLPWQPSQKKPGDKGVFQFFHPVFLLVFFFEKQKKTPIFFAPSKPRHRKNVESPEFAG